MDHKFELLLKNNRNWLSKYGGLISVCIIAILIYGVFQIRIPQYEMVAVVEKNIVSIPAASTLQVAKGDILEVENVKGDTFALTIVATAEKETQNWITYTSDTHLDATEAYKTIIAEHSLLKSLTNSLFKK